MRYPRDFKRSANAKARSQGLRQARRDKGFAAFLAFNLEA